MHAWRDILRLSAEYLVQKGVPDAQVAAELLVARLLKCGRGFLSPHLEETPDSKYVEAMRRGIARLGAGEPVQYVLGESGGLPTTSSRFVKPFCPNAFVSPFISTTPLYSNVTIS